VTCSAAPGVAGGAANISDKTLLGIEKILKASKGLIESED
jgi:hypothetical protein